jgi:Mg2+/citrate symporter
MPAALGFLAILVLLAVILTRRNSALTALVPWSLRSLPS